MARFTNIEQAARQGNIGDTIEGRLIHWGYGTGDYEIAWRGQGNILIRGGNSYKFVENNGAIPLDSFIGAEWTVETVLAALGAEYALAAGMVKADEHERVQ